MIHYHGTPITPRFKLLEMSGRHFCVSFAHPSDINVCLEIGQSVMLDNGAFTAYTQGKNLEKFKYFDWCEKYLGHPHWAVIPDVIGGSIDEQKNYMKDWPFPKDLSAPVWHLNLSLDWLLELVDEYGKVCLGSSGEFWQIGVKKWEQRMDQVFEVLSKRRYMPWIHGMRMLGQSNGRWPLASADSTNVARNHATRKIHPEIMAAKIDKIQTPLKWKKTPQISLIEEAADG